MFFLRVESASDGAVSNPSSLKPSKPFLLYATLPVNNSPLHTLIDTGASATCISRKALERMSNFRYVDKVSRSFILADGVIPLQIHGKVELSMRFGQAVLHFYALVTETLCVDLILGMEFMLTYRATIDVHSQQFSVEVQGHRITLRVDDQLRRPLVPLHSCHATWIPPRSSRNISVSSPISSLSTYFIPTSLFLEAPHLSSSQRTVTIQHHRSSLLVTNASDFPQHLPQYFCFGYLLSPHAEHRGYSDRISALCQQYNEKKNRQIRSALASTAQLRSRHRNHSLHRSPPIPLSMTAVVGSDPPYRTFALKNTLDLLSQHLLDASQRNTLSSLLTQFSGLFDNSRHNISDAVIENVFNTIPHSPPASRPHRNPHHRQETQRLIEEFFDAGIIQESNSPYAAPGFIVPRKDNRPGRLVVDYRALNKITIPDASPLPHGEDLLQELGKGYRYFSKLDLKSGYHQFRIPAADRPKTAFVVSQGHYEFLVLPMGPQNAPAGFQKIMYNIMKPCRAFSQVFLDDMVIYSQTFDEHIQHLRLVFETLAKAKLVLNASKCELAVESVVVLGHRVSETSITPRTDALQAILDLPEPRTLKQANKFLGGLAYYRKFIPHFADTAAPIHQVANLTRDKRHLFKWTTAQSQAFGALIRQLTTAPLFLHFPVVGVPLQLCTDASGIATGGVLFQDIHGQRHNLFYHSQVLSPSEQKYSVPEKEALAILHCLQRMRTLVLGQTVHIHTDHCPICGMLTKPVNNRRIERVANLIQEYQIAEMKHISGKSNCLADYLSRPFDDPLFDIPYGLESKIPTLPPADSLSILTPSTNVVSTMTLRPRHKPCSPSGCAPEVALDGQVDISSSPPTSDSNDVPHTTTAPSPNSFDSAELHRAQAQDAEVCRILHELTTTRNNRSTLSSSFILKNNLLHKLVCLTPRSIRKTAVPYLPSSMVKSLLIAMHDDPYQGGHFSTDKMLSKIRCRYWWPQMRTSVQLHVQACVPCQQYNYDRQKKPGHLRPIPPTAIPFHIIGMDFCGPFVESPRNNKYVLVITDLFTHYVTAVPLPASTAEVTAFTLFRHIFCKYGVCSTLLTDQGSHFNNHLMRALQHLLGYHHILSTPYHPQTNGVVERFNASMVVQVSKLQQTHHNNWDDYLDAIVFAYNVSQHKTTKYSPFELLFGRSPILPIDSPPRYFHFDRPNAYFETLQRTLRVYHQHAKENIVEQQRYNKHRYDQNRQDPHYVLGDRVFTKIFSARGKLDPRYSADPKIIVHTNHPTYVVRHEPTGVENRYHVSDLRPVILASHDDSSENFVVGRGCSVSLHEH
jgi:transposase InsO family protein